MPAPHMASEPATHLLVPFASASDPACRALLPGLSLPHLTALLAQLQPVHTDSGTDHSLSAPHERALAQAIGLLRADGSAYPDGLLPWAAAQSYTPETPQAWFTPCHFQVGMEQVTLLPGDQLGLTDEHARPLFDALAPYCAEDGITLRFESATRWHASGEVLRGIACASLDRVGGRSVEAWMTDSSANPAGGQLLKRLQSEAQMLFYTHPAHDAREALRLHPVNGFWLSGAGAIDHPTTLQAAPAMPDPLRSAALQADWTRWKDAWSDLDGRDIQDLLERVRRGEPVTLTLCGERAAQRFTNAPRGAVARAGRLIQQWLGNAPAWKTLETL
ncbi:MAG: phosphoglycerate mutase [Hydrogenophaga sp.]|uniref:phosphoglycerate mutase n=1 Tax=Hydrogenophaga sp. TaxID=1904254 RepID=UPI002731E7C1|nr:phosphoglycerate mutase [Hydrogenophaga sp.]MDP2251265.1 phosphoglycerate mutase [Hydrogenophaga sp.]MDZ4130049.1 phosphoglycerate mutase [Hydrogenophaga sp.]